MIVNNPCIIKLEIGYYAYERYGVVHIRKNGDVKNTVLCTLVSDKSGFFTINPNKIINCPKCKQLYRLANKK